MRVLYRCVHIPGQKDDPVTHAAHSALVVAVQSVVLYSPTWSQVSHVLHCALLYPSHSEEAHDAASHVVHGVHVVPFT